MFKNRKLLGMIGAVGFFMGIFLLMGTFNVAQARELPADVEKWLKKNKIGPFQENTIDYDVLYQAAKPNQDGCLNAGLITINCSNGSWLSILMLKFVSWELKTTSFPVTCTLTQGSLTCEAG